MYKQMNERGYFINCAQQSEQALRIHVKMLYTDF